ncbi:MAG: UDP-N-acetylmuramate dehydrogenase [Thiobacillaceae bacterium]|nr:UDP-N-acetylmuramate dehydrogenase [Thiobacillaceae bacterium]MDW8322649.1 UDP-N-acetylmuramate dehydrogenase [Burkholderiales bacterium]
MTLGELERRIPGLRGELAFRVDMSRHVSWRAGGPVERLYVPADLQDLAVFLKTLEPGEPILFVGLGSNLLIRDGGFHGTVILTHKALGALRLESRRQGTAWGGQDPGRFGVIFAEAGVASPKVARFAARHDLVGAEFLAGIPGTVGGALAMNAGCYGHETWEIVVQVLTIDRQGQVHTRQPRDYRVGYRQVAAGEQREEWFVAAWFLLPRGDGEAARVRIKELLARRVASQPLHQPNAGSVFRNPPGDFAARLIEACGLKGLRIGGAQVSDKHANFIVNLGGATAEDIERLIEQVELTVEARTGVRLEREVRIVGERV